MHEILSGSKRAKTGLGVALHDLRSVRALVIDGNVTTRSILRTMLIDLGLQGDHIKHCLLYTSPSPRDS